ncbi:MAG: hypothetical protein HKN85_04765 [Gammaproteobacteria bacterium]|nr:hypothetical protein [Gammaproteobacteria bacterium]
MATGQTDKKTSQSVVFGLLVLLATVAVVVLGYHSSKAWSYQKIYPFAVDISITAKANARLSVQYDYGYGYLPEHLQIVEFEGADGVQQIELSISAWKIPRKLRLWSTQANQLKLQSISMQQAGRVLEMIPATGTGDPNVIREFSLDLEQGAL